MLNPRNIHETPKRYAKLALPYIVLYSREREKGKRKRKRKRERKKEKRKRYKRRKNDLDEADPDMRVLRD